jgi:hypothetical protein
VRASIMSHVLNAVIVALRVAQPAHAGRWGRSVESDKFLGAFVVI